MYTVMKFQSPFERSKQYSFSSEVALCKAIITQAIIDSTNTSYDMDARREEIEAKHWLFSNLEDFITICDGANMSPYFVRKITKAAILLQHQKKHAQKKKAHIKKKKAQTTVDRTELVKKYKKII